MCELYDSNNYEDQPLIVNSVEWDLKNNTSNVEAFNLFLDYATYSIKRDYK